MCSMSFLKEYISKYFSPLKCSVFSCINASFEEDRCLAAVDHKGLNNWHVIQNDSKYQQVGLTKGLTDNG